MKTYADIKAEIAKLETQAEKMREAEKAGVVGRIKDAIATYGLTARDLGFGDGARSPAGKRQSANKQKATVGVAKYRDPQTGKTWTGRGKPPNWIVAAKDQTPFLIDGSTEQAGSKKGRKAAKAAGTRGKRSSGTSAATKRMRSAAKSPSVQSESATALQ